MLKKALTLTLVVFGVLACGQNEGDKTTGPQFTAKAPVAGREYVFAIHPPHNPARLFEIYGPLIDYLNRNIPGATFRLEASRNYEEFEKKLYARQFDFALPNPYQTLNSLSYGYHVIAKMGTTTSSPASFWSGATAASRRYQTSRAKKCRTPPALPWLPP